MGRIYLGQTSVTNDGIGDVCSWHSVLLDIPLMDSFNAKATTAGISSSIIETPTTQYIGDSTLEKKHFRQSKKK